MFCYQCQQTINNQGCTRAGVCSKTPAQSMLQDIIVSLCGLIEQNIKTNELLYIKSMFRTVTNVNHSNSDLEKNLWELELIRDRMHHQELSMQVDNAIVDYKNGNYSSMLSAKYFEQKLGADINSLFQLGIQGLKGACAYADDAYEVIQYLLHQDHIYSNYHITLISYINQLYQQHQSLLDLTKQSQLSDALNILLQIGQINFSITKLLSDVNIKLSGPVSIQQPIVGKYQINTPMIIISGHSYSDMIQLFNYLDQQSQLPFVAVYTHGEMLPAVQYEKIRNNKHFYGNIGSCWCNQLQELKTFPGVAVFTTNCIMNSQNSQLHYNSISTNVVGYNGVEHFQDWKQVVDKSIKIGGFKNQNEIDEFQKRVSNKYYGAVGFQYSVAEELIDKIVYLIKNKKLTKVQINAGCDAKFLSRKIFTEKAQQVDNSTLILTAGCQRYRINQINYKQTIFDLPQLLDVGQCNDVNQIIQFAILLTKKLNLNSVNDLPLELYVAWYEQKANVQLLTMLSFGIKNINLGPTLCSCLTENVISILNQKFGLKQIQ